MTFFRPGTRGAAIGAAFHKTTLLFRWPGVELEPDGLSFRIGAFWQPEREENPMQKVNRRSAVARELRVEQDGKTFKRQYVGLRARVRARHGVLVVGEEM
jgi:hypothetical protein